MARKIVKRSRNYTLALRTERETPSDQKKIMELLSRASEEGDDRATYAIATWYLHGKNVKKDVNLAVKLLREAASSGNSSALFDLAYSYEAGIGVDRDQRTALLLYIESALNGDKQAVYEVSRCYWYGVGTKSDREMSNIWRQRASILGISGISDINET